MTRQKEISQEVSNRPRLPPTSGDVAPTPAHRGRCALRGAVWVRGDVESNPRDVEDAVPYGVLVCEPPRIAALPNATAHVRRRGKTPYNRVK